MSKNQQSMTSSNVLLGILAGTVVGAIAAAVASSSRAKGLKDDLCDAYNDASKKIGKNARHFSDKTHSFTDRFLNPHHSEKNLTVTIGAIAGGIIGLSALAFLATSDSAKGVREQVVNSFETMTDKAHCLEDIACNAANSIEENVTPWIHKVTCFLDTLNEAASSHRSKKSSFNGHEPIDKILDWAVVAAQLFQSFKK